MYCFNEKSCKHALTCRRYGSVLSRVASVNGFSGSFIAFSTRSTKTTGCLVLSGSVSKISILLKICHRPAGFYILSLDIIFVSYTPFHVYRVYF